MSAQAAPTRAPDRAITKLRDDMNRLRGRLFQAVEACGLPDRQEAAIKGLIRQLSYDTQADLESALRGRNT